ncbi:MAG TPA: ABC transporter permease [Candidatus Margulisiibacteriota bacterium]|nr:ABC transporter permease [Candidatus Margulisiibacteriota bacterium]
MSVNRVTARVLPSLLALASALIVSAVIIAASGRNPATAFAALLAGAFGSLDSLSEVGVKACPLLLTGLAIAVSFRAGVWNIGAEGQLLMGALALAGLGTHRGRLPAWLDLVSDLALAAAVGAAWAGLAGQLKLRRNVNEIISTIMLNFIALGLVSYLVQGPLMEAGGRYPQTDAILPALWMPRLAPYRVHLGLLIACVAAVALHILLYRTVPGYEMRAAGINPAAARLAGIDVDRRLLMALMLSGALAGLAGAIEVSAVTRRLYERFSPGWGFTAIAVGLLGRLSPAGVVAAAIFFGALDAGSNAMQRAAGVSSVLVSVIQATVILFLVAFEGSRWLAEQPRADGG